MLTEDVPITLADAVAGFASADGRKFEGTVNERVRVCYIKPFPKGEEIVPLGIIVRCVGWANEMCFCAQRWMQDILATMELEPITLIDGVVSPIGGVAYVELKQEASVQRARGV